MTRNRVGSAAASGPAVTGRTVRSTVVKSPLVLTRSPGWRTGSLLRHGFVQGGGQLPPQPFAGHLQDVHAGLARGRFQVPAGAAVEVEDVAALVDERADRGVLLQQRPFGQLAQRELAFAGRLSGGPRGGSIFRHGREKLSHGRAVCAVNILFALIQLRLAVQRGKEVRELAHGLGGAQEEHAARVQARSGTGG